MGNHLAPPLAIVFMDKLETSMLLTAKQKPMFYDRYVDDIIMAWRHGKDNLEKFIEHCNTRHHTIRFTWDYTKNNGTPVSFMDLSVRIREYRLIHELFRKPSDSGVNLSFDSQIPESVKMAVATQQFRRAEALSSSADAYQRSSDKIRQVLSENSFPTRAIEEAFSRCTTSTKKKQTKEKVTLKLPFLSDKLHKIVRLIVRQSNMPLRVVHERGRSLKDHLIRSAFTKERTCATHELFIEQESCAKRARGKPRDDCVSCKAGVQPGCCAQANVVYALKCKLCGEEYVGETRRTVRTRIGEHHFHARNSTPGTAWGDHMRQHHPEQKIDKEPVFGNARILAATSEDSQRKLREAIEIREIRPAINKSKGWTLTGAYTK